jgi:hypothetical protein
MTDERAALTIHLAAGPDADPEELDELTRRLRLELLELDVHSVELARAGEVPPGARAGDATAVGTLVVGLLQTPELLVALVGLVQAWLVRDRRRSARLELGGDVLEVSGLSAGDQRELLRAWVERAGGEPARQGG